MRRKLLLGVVVLFWCLAGFGFCKNVLAVSQENGNGKVFWRDVMSDGGDYRYDRSLALDNLGYPHVCSHQTSGSGMLTKNLLKHIYWDGALWQDETVDGGFSFIYGSNFGKYCSITIDTTTDNVHVSYYSDSDLKYRKKSGSTGAWDDSVTVDSDGDTGLYTSIVLTSDGLPHIFYQYHIDGNNNRLKHAYYTGAGWLVETVLAGNVGYYNSAVVDQNNNIHVAYWDANDSRIEYVLRYSNGTWHAGAVYVGLSSSLLGISLAVGNDNIVRISYNIQGPGSSLRVATGTEDGFVDSEWDFNPNFDVGEYSSIALDSQNNAYVSYYYEGAGLKYAYSSSGSVTTEVIASSIIEYTSLAYKNDNAFIAYYNLTNNNLNFVLMDSVAPSGAAEVLGKAGKEFSWKITSSDYVQMGGAKYYCIDENNTCVPLTSGTALTSAIANGTYTASSSSVTKAYLRLGDWAGNIASITLNMPSANKEVSLKQTPVEGEEIINYDLTYVWKKLPKNSENYWMQTTRYNKYTKKYKNYKRNIIKRYWKIKTNLNEYRESYRKKLTVAEKNYSDCHKDLKCSSVILKYYKKQVLKYQKKMFRVRVSFYYTQKLSNKLRLKNSDLKKLAKKQAEKKLWLKKYDKKTKKWNNMSQLKLVNKTVHNLKKNSFVTDIKYFKTKNTLFTIGVK